MGVTLVIFGAGASFDSVDLTYAPDLRSKVDIGAAYRPPLANQLFDERYDFIAAMNNWPEMAMLVQRLRHAAATVTGPSIEETLRQIQDEGEGFTWRRSHLIALRFYLREILDEPVQEWLRDAGRATNYNGLLDQLGVLRGADLGKKWLFVNFNYDRLFESALEDVHGWRCHRFEDYMTGDFALIKPHGSVSWRQVVSDGTGRERVWDPHELIKIASQSPLQDIRLETVDDPFDGQPWYPAIAIPVDRAKTFLLPPAHRERLVADLEEVTSILIVGWRASEQHFIDLLAQCLPKERTIPTWIVDFHSRDLLREPNPVGGGYPVRDALQKALGGAVKFDFVVNNDGFSSFVAHRAVMEMPIS